MNILLFGKGGQVGRELSRRLLSLGRVTAYGSCDVSFDRPHAVADAVRAVRPDVIVNAAAYTAVDRAEEEPEQARTVNADAVAAIAGEAYSLGALVIHYSTDYVFDGTKPGPYVESDPASPLSVYGATKLAGEEALRSTGCRSLVLRTSWVYSAQGQNFVRTILRLGQERSDLRVVDDQIGAPTPATLLAEVTAMAVRRSGSEEALPEGTYHLAPRGATSWHGFARCILAAAQDLGVALQCPPECVKPIPTTAYPMAARRPLNSRLSSAKLESALGEHMPHWEEGVAAAVAAWSQENHQKTMSPGAA